MDERLRSFTGLFEAVDVGDILVVQRGERLGQHPGAYALVTATLPGTTRAAEEIVSPVTSIIRVLARARTRADASRSSKWRARTRS